MVVYRLLYVAPFTCSIISNNGHFRILVSRIVLDAVDVYESYLKTFIFVYRHVCSLFSKMPASPLGGCGGVID
jgi:hypothetical protein